MDKLPESYWRARAFEAEHQAQDAENDEFDAKLELINLFELVAPKNATSIPSINHPTKGLAEDIFRMVKDEHERIEGEVYSAAVEDVCNWLREKPPISEGGLPTIADAIGEHFGIG